LAKVQIYQELCKGVEECGLCVAMCPKKLFSPSEQLNRKGYRPPQAPATEACTQCLNCMLFCPDLAIAVEERKTAKGGKA
jgi:2-oxoglutarate ferredoxin oxidoreductase subunit delta